MKLQSVVRWGLPLTCFERKFVLLLSIVVVQSTHFHSTESAGRRIRSGHSGNTVCSLQILWCYIVKYIRLTISKYRKHFCNRNTKTILWKAFIKYNGSKKLMRKSIETKKSKIEDIQDVLMQSITQHWLHWSANKMEMTIYKQTLNSLSLQSVANIIMNQIIISNW